MSVIEFLCKKTRVGELCVIRESGYIVATAYIDAEDIFRVHESLASSEVQKDSWGTLDIVNKSGREVTVPCHFVDV